MMVVVVHHRSKWRMLVEICGTLTFTKQGILFWRTFTNARPLGHELLPPVSEMMMFQGIEVFAECIPMAVIQVQNILDR